MFKINPLYSNFIYLNGDLNSFIEDNNSVFVLMPFGSEKDITKTQFDEIFNCIKETIEKDCFHGNKLSCTRADIENGLIVMADIGAKIKKTGLIIVDISIPNHNVNFELGLSCALDKKILLTYNPELYYTSNTEEKIPFDINQFRYIEYRNIKELRQKLVHQVESFFKVEDSSKIDLFQIFIKLQKITRHLGLDTKAEQFKEDYNLSDYEIDVACDILDEYIENESLEKNNFKDIDYWEIEIKIRAKLNTNDWNRVKDILEYLYWAGHYQKLLANMKGPMEFWGIKKDYFKKNGKGK